MSYCTHTIHFLDVFHILKGELEISVGDEIVGWVHDSARVRGVRKAQCVPKLMCCHSKQVVACKSKNAKSHAGFHTPDK